MANQHPILELGPDPPVVDTNGRNRDPMTHEERMAKITYEDYSDNQVSCICQTLLRKNRMDKLREFIECFTRYETYSEGKRNTLTLAWQHLAYVTIMTEVKRKAHDQRVKMRNHHRMELFRAIKSQTGGQASVNAEPHSMGPPSGQPRPRNSLGQYSRDKNPN